MAKKDKYPRRVLVARFSALGDVCMVIPVLYSLCRQYPDSTFVFVTKKATTGVFINRPDNLVVYGADVKGEYAGFTGSWRLFRMLNRQYHFDGFADLHDVIRSQLIRLSCRIRGVKVAFIRKGRREKFHLVHHYGGPQRQLSTSTERYIDVFRRLGFDFKPEFHSLFPAEGADPASFADITAPKSSGEQWIAIAPFAAHVGKIYPQELMEQVISNLSQRPKTHIFLFGGGDHEREVLAHWAAKYPGVTSMAEKRHGFPKELALLSHCDVMVSMDSANMHLASLVGLPVVSIWGATHPFCGFYGWNQDEANIVQIDLDCRPCSVFGNRECSRGDYPCLRGIAPAMVVDRVEKVLSYQSKN